MSAYKNLYAVHEEPTITEPVGWSHFRSRLTGRDATILSRVSPVAADHTGRSNKLAHHVLIPARERVEAGPVWVSQQPGFFIDSWNGPAHFLESPKQLPTGELISGVAVSWQALTGDAGHAACLAEAYLSNPDGIVLVIFSPGIDLLPLLGESMALLPPQERWQVTYSTYFTGLPVGATCNWRCCVAGSVFCRESSRLPGVKIIDLTEELPSPKEGNLTELARLGQPEPEKKATETEPSEEKRPRRRMTSTSQRNINMLNLKPRKPE